MAMALLSGITWKERKPFQKTHQIIGPTKGLKGEDMAYTYKGKKPVLEDPGAAPVAPVVDPYQSVYSEEITKLADSIANRDPFQYNQNSDPAFKAYAEQYTRLGERSAQDVVGQGAALTGGVASSYAISAAGQAKSNYDQQLMNIVPALMEAAYSKYKGEFDMDNQALGSIQGVEDSNFGKYRDNRDFTQGQYETQLGQFNQDRGYGLDLYNGEMDQYNSDRGFEYQQYQDGISNSIARSKAGDDEEYALPADFQPSMNATSLRVEFSYWKTDPEKAQKVVQDQYDRGLLSDEDVFYLMGIINK